MRYGTRALISVGWLAVYNLVTTFTEPVQAPVWLYYVQVGFTYAPMLLALLVWFEWPKILYKRFMN